MLQILRQKALNIKWTMNSYVQPLFSLLPPSYWEAAFTIFLAHILSPRLTKKRTGREKVVGGEVWFLKRAYFFYFTPCGEKTITILSVVWREKTQDMSRQVMVVGI